MLRRDLLPSKFLKQTDFDIAGTILTISHITKQNISKEDDMPEYKWILFFKETGEVGLVLNSTTSKSLFDICGEESDEWSGQEIVLFVDPNVMFGEKRTGGLRLRQNVVPQAPKTMNRAPMRAPSQHDNDAPY
jgi:hypothetical protein